MNKQRWLLAALIPLVTACGGGGDGSASGSSAGNDTGTTTSSYSDLSGLVSKFSLPPQDANGWSILTPSADSRLIYVSRSGNDSTAQVYSPSSAEVGPDPFKPSGTILPYASIDTALTKARIGYPDYILLKRGDTWTETAAIHLKAGRSATERAVLGYYGSASARPVVKHYGVELSWASYSAVIGIRFLASQRNPADADFAGFGNVADLSGFNALAGYGGTVTGGLLIEDCWFDWFAGNVLQSPLSTAPALTDLIVRRNIITNNYSTDAHAQGLYSARASILLEENIFDHNGWYKQGDTNFSDPSEGKATMFNHNTYFGEARDTLFRNNLFLRASSIGSKFTSNTTSGTNAIKAWNLVIDNNLYVEGEVGISLGGNDDQNNGPRWRNIHVTNNVMMHIGRTQPTLRTLGWGLDVNDWDSGIVSGNIFTTWGDATLNNNYAIYTHGDTNDVSYTGNITYNVHSGGPLVYFLDGALNKRSQYTGNDLSINNAGTLVSYTLTSNNGFGNNYFYSTAAASRWFLINGTNSTLDQYRAASGDTTSVAGRRGYAHPERTVETYLASLGHATDMNSFVALLTQQSKFNWVPALQAAAINDYIRAGFAAP